MNLNICSFIYYPILPFVLAKLWKWENSSNILAKLWMNLSNVTPSPPQLVFLIWCLLNIGGSLWFPTAGISFPFSMSRGKRQCQGNVKYMSRGKANGSRSMTSKGKRQKENDIKRQKTADQWHQKTKVFFYETQLI